MPDPIRVGVIGLAHGHGPIWARAFAENADCELVAIYDHEPERLRDIAAELTVDADSDLENFLRRDLDAVSITSEHALHREHIEAAVRTGVAVLCEKPLATSLADAEELGTIVEKSHVRFMQGFQMRLDPANIEVKHRVQTGQLGRVSSIIKRHSHAFGLTGWPNNAETWFLEPHLSGGGAGLDALIHSCDWLRWTFGEVESVTAMTSDHMLEAAVEDQIVAIFRLRSGALATLVSGWTEVAGTVTTQISGELGAIIQLYTDVGSVRSGRPFDASVLHYAEATREWATVLPAHTFPRVHEAVADAFVRCLISDEPFPSGFDDGKQALAMVLASYESARTRKSVALHPERAHG